MNKQNKPLREFQFQDEYLTHSAHEPKHLYRDALARANLLRRASGYFSSSVLELFRKEILEFVQEGGRLELICSPSLSEEDLKEISLGYGIPKVLEKRLIKDVKQLVSMTELNHNLSFVATLIKLQFLQIKIAIFDRGQGIFHDKSGYFMDFQDNYLSFSGSANDSYSAFSGRGNFERIQTFSSWVDDDAPRCTANINYIDSLWLDKVKGLTVTHFPNVAKEILLKYSLENLPSPNFPIPELENIKSPKLADKKIDNLMEHQELAIQNWKKAGCVGILKHATGSGKTVTAISAISEHQKSGKPTFILVPSKLLLNQWFKELNEELQGCVVLRCGGGHVKWKEGHTLRSFFRKVDIGEPGNIILAINDTAASKQFLTEIVNHQETLLVADEVHSLGSAGVSILLKETFQYRLGLSATPERHRDKEGTDKIFDCFREIISPEVTLKDALESGRLVPYDYFPEVTTLSASEEAEWELQTRKIINYLKYNKNENGQINNDETLRKLFIKRSRIAKKAASKTKKIFDIISKNFSDGDRWLIYCEDSSQLEEVQHQLQLKNYAPLIYTSTLQGSPTEELKSFTNDGGILLAIRCLDEGVDIPKISHAIIAASSQNPRQFIQRRGRVLRKAEGKLNAVIFDCIVSPANANTNSSYDSLVMNELARSMEFAQTARNSLTAMGRIRKVIISMGDDPDKIISELEEGYEEI